MLRIQILKPANKYGRHQAKPIIQVASHFHVFY
jgi:hypothetical protein